MKRHLLDVNALIAMEHRGAPHHSKFHLWAKASGLDSLTTCAHSELGFIRVSMQAFGYTLPDAEKALGEIKRKLGGFIDSAPSPKLAAWASTAQKTSDAYLIQVAVKNGLTLATFDKGITDPVALHIA